MSNETKPQTAIDWLWSQIPFGCELDKEYFDNGIKRIKSHISQLKAEFPI